MAPMPIFGSDVAKSIVKDD